VRILPTVVGNVKVDHEQNLDPRSSLIRSAIVPYHYRVLRDHVSHIFDGNCIILAYRYNAQFYVQELGSFLERCMSGDRYHHLWLFDPFDFTAVISVRFTRQYDRFRATCSHLKHRASRDEYMEYMKNEHMGKEKHRRDTHGTATIVISVEQTAGYPNYFCLQFTNACEHVWM
jgi:hypothetical protein